MNISCNKEYAILEARFSEALTAEHSLLTCCMFLVFFEGNICVYFVSESLMNKKGLKMVLFCLFVFFGLLSKA